MQYSGWLVAAATLAFTVRSGNFILLATPARITIFRGKEAAAGMRHPIDAGRHILPSTFDCFR